MSPRPGGEADKVGNRYESAWIVSHLLKVLRRDGTSIVVEPIGDLGDGIEFAYTRTDGAVETHQVKRQDGTANHWTVHSLNSRGIWAAAKAQVDAGHEYHFASIIPSAVLQELCNRSRQSETFDDLRCPLADQRRVAICFHGLDRTLHFQHARGRLADHP